MKRLGLFDDDVLIGENAKCRFYVTSITQDLTDKARKMDIRGIELRGWQVVVAESKEDNSRMFLLIDDKGFPVRDSSSMDGMSWEIDFIKMGMTVDYDIVEMAEKRNGTMRRKKEGKRKLPRLTRKEEEE